MAGISSGQYISALCDGTGTNSSVQCTDCTTQCPSDDFYMDPNVVCSGTARFDERAAAGCRACRPSGCGSGKYISGRCLRVNRPTRDTTDCVSCSSCLTNQYISNPCNGSTFSDTRQCSACRYNSTSCGSGSYTINLCTSGSDLVDRTMCSTCNANCRRANFSIADPGQFIGVTCGEIPNSNGDNACVTCTASCAVGSYISAPCTGLTQQDTQCSSCKTQCATDEFISVGSL